MGDHARYGPFNNANPIRNQRCVNASARYGKDRERHDHRRQAEHVTYPSARFALEAPETAALGSIHTIEVYDFGMTEEGDFY